MIFFIQKYRAKVKFDTRIFNSIELYFKHKFLNVKFRPNYTRKADDLYAAYGFIDNHELNLKNVQQAHSILSSKLLPKSQQGRIRTNPMFVINSDDKLNTLRQDLKL